MNDAPLWDRVFAEFADRRAEFADFDWEPDALVHRDNKGLHVPEAETLFAVSNGFIGVRGAVEEDEPSYERATLINGFHETWPIVYGEAAYGFATTGQTIVGVPDPTLMKLYVDDEPFRMDRVVVRRSERRLDWRAGILRREVEWETPDGRSLVLRTRRFASLEHRHVVVFDYEVEMLDASGTLTISSELAVPEPRSDADEGEDPRRSRSHDGVLVPVSDSAQDQRAVLTLATRRSAMTVACGMHHTVQDGSGLECTTSTEPGVARTVAIVDAQPEEPVRVQKFVAYHSSNRTGADELAFRVDQTLDRALHVGIEELGARQGERMRRYWDIADVKIDGCDDAQSMVRFNLFQVHQNTSRADGFGFPAKGLTGTGYEGQYFWDADIYILPHLAYTQPQLARNFVGFRAGMLEPARTRAREVGHRGALYPWRTINGQEASAYYAAGTAQCHINADVVWAMRKYVRATGDLEAIADPGFEMLIETARFWVDLGFFSDRMGGEFVINGVTGPDEYTTVVDNNLYTNLMARENLLGAVEAAEWMRVRRPEDYQRIMQRTRLEEDEIAVWMRAGESMHIPWDDQQRLYLQDDGFLNREMWDFANTPEENYPLLLHYHPLEIYRHQVIKQADVVMATFLLGDWFSEEEKRRVFEYFDPLTTGDSSLSASVQSVMATELGLTQNGLEYFVQSALVDLLDLSGNVCDGIHLAACGGTWQAMIHGFGGFRDHGGDLRFQPVIPSGWQGLTFRLRYHDHVIQVHAGHDQVDYTLIEGERAIVYHWDDEIVLSSGASETRRNPRREELPKLAHAADRALAEHRGESHDSTDWNLEHPAVPFT
ncbi:MAG: glycoside hydrolase family 65 protein [Microthrixaceae bacterium]